MPPQDPRARANHPARAKQHAPARRHEPAGHAARDAAVSGLYAVFVERRAFDDAFAKAADTRSLQPRDRAFARLVATSVLRHRAALQTVIASYLQKPLPRNLGRLEAILLAAAAQLLLLKTPAHAVISIAVDQCRADGAARFDKLTNAVLRRVASEEGASRFAAADPTATVPGWLMARWVKAYGEPLARAIAAASLSEPPLDLSVKDNAAEWAARLGGVALATGTVRLTHAGRIEELEGYDDGGWWVQDAAAALPARLLGDLSGKRVADVCAAPGGKTAQLAAAGADVTAIDKSPGRLKRLAVNLQRLGLTAETRVADAEAIALDEAFDAVLVDAPCTATGTIRRHPDVLYLKQEADIAALALRQARILDVAAKLVKPTGKLVYCTCSLEPEEGEERIAAFLAAHPEFSRSPISPGECAIAPDWLSTAGELRTLPCHLGDVGGMDGFFAARLIRTA